MVFYQNLIMLGLGCNLNLNRAQHNLFAIGEYFLSSYMETINSIFSSCGNIGDTGIFGDHDA